MNSEQPKRSEIIFENVAGRYDNRPGFDLVSCREVGLPVYKITVRALTQIRKPIPPIEEYILKAIDAGLSSEEEIGGFLGLELPILREAMTNLRVSEDIDLIAPAGEAVQVWRLTKKGERSLAEAGSIVPEERTFTIDFDGLLRKVHWYGRLESRLLKPQELRSRGTIEIPPFPAKFPELSDIGLADVDDVISQIEKSRSKQRPEEREFLALKAIERRQRVFQKAFALVYQAKDSDAVQVAFAIDGIISNDHERAFARADGAKKMRIVEGIRASSASKLVRQILGSELVDIAPLKEAETLKSQEVTVRAEVEATRQSLEKADSQEEKERLKQQLQKAQRQIEELKARQASAPVRWLGVYEHRPLLEKALLDSQKRLLIISPWIRANATNKWLLKKLEDLLKCGVKVSIGYGLGETQKDKKQKDINANDAVKKLNDRYDNFCLKRLGDTHAKILICDNKFAVVGSFNWLSFKGDPNWTFRDERGVLVSDPQQINELFDQEAKRLRE